MVTTISFCCLCHFSLMHHLYYVFYTFRFYNFCVTLDKDFNNNNNNNINNNNNNNNNIIIIRGKDASGRGTNLVRVFLLPFYTCPKSEK